MSKFVIQKKTLHEACKGLGYVEFYPEDDPEAKVKIDCGCNNGYLYEEVDLSEALKEIDTPNLKPNFNPLSHTDETFESQLERNLRDIKDNYDGDFQAWAQNAEKSIDNSKIEIARCERSTLFLKLRAEAEGLHLISPKATDHDAYIFLRDILNAHAQDKSFENRYQHTPYEEPSNQV
jgi:hypothetical protein